MSQTTRLTPTTLAGVLLALALAIIATTLVVVSGSEPEATPESAVAQPAPQEESSASEAPTDEPAEDDEVVGDPDELLPLVTYEVFLARDPFEPLVPSGGGGDGTGTTGGTDGGTTGGTDGGTTGGTDGDTTGGTDGGTTDGGTDGTDPCTQNGEVVCDGHVVSLVDVFVDEDGTERAVIQVDESIYEVVAGQQFATNFQVSSIDPPCVTLLYGDDAFSLCEGEQVLK